MRSPGRLYAIALGGAWAILGIAKLVSPVELALFLQREAHLGRASAQALASGTAAVEILLGATLILMAHRRGLTGAALWASLGLGLMLVTLSLIAGEGLSQCGCLGVFGRATFGKRLVISGTLVLLSASAILARQPGSRSRVSRQRPPGS